MSSSVKEKLLLYLIGVFAVSLIGFLFTFLRPTSANYLYSDKIITEENILINYPYFNIEGINTHLNNYIKNINRYSFDEVKYIVNYVDNYISILFTKSKDGKIVDYDSFIYDKEGNLVNILGIVSDENILKERVKPYLERDNIIINNYDNSEFNYVLKDKVLEVIIISEDNLLKSINIVDINYNDIKDILKISYEIDNDSLENITINTTTITTTTHIPEKVIAFTFDDGPSKYTLEILDVLDEYGAKATFFEVGYMINSRRDIVLEVLNRGFEIGNHTYDHSNLNKLTSEKVLEKINSNNDLYHEITGKDMMLLRPPYGNCKSSVKEIITVPIIKWSVDSRDWESRNTDKIVALVESTTKDGDIVLFHDLYPTTLEAIKILVPYFYNQGYEIVSVSDLFRFKNIPLENGHIYYNARG